MVFTSALRRAAVASFVLSQSTTRSISTTSFNNRNTISRIARNTLIPFDSRLVASPTVRSSYNQHMLFSTGPVWQHGALPRPSPGTGLKVHFIKQDGEKVTVEANDGESLLDVARANDLDVEGACEASLACSTCHLILDENSFNKLEEPSDEENDMLDLAYGLTDTSRLGCQVLMSKELDGLTAKIPSATRNMYVDGAKPKHH